jgi:hypothetical protein
VVRLAQFRMEQSPLTGLRDGNCELYARRFDAAAHEWGELARLTLHLLLDINPPLASPHRARFALP